MEPFVFYTFNIILIKMDQESSSIRMVFFKFVFFEWKYFSKSRRSSKIQKWSSKIHCFEQIFSKLVEWNTVFDHYDLVFRQNIYFVIKSYANNFESKCHLQGRLPLDTKVKWITFGKICALECAFYVVLLFVLFEDLVIPKNGPAVKSM